MAGLWSVWKCRPRRHTPLLSCTIITTDAVGRAGRDPRPDAADAGRGRLGPLAESRRPDGSRVCCAATPDVRDIELREVSKLVNSVRNNGPELLEPAEPRARAGHAVLGARMRSHRPCSGAGRRRSGPATTWNVWGAVFELGQSVRVGRAIPRRDGAQSLTIGCCARRQRQGCVGSALGQLALLLVRIFGAERI